MSHSKLNLSRSTATRRAIIDGIQASRRNDGRHPIAGRTPGKFPLALTIGLMTIGVIVAISALQVLAAFVD